MGIAGGSGAGKTHLLMQLALAFRDNAAFLSEDNYYKEVSRQAKDDNGIVNFDLPNSIDHELFLTHLKKIKMGESIRIREYTFNNPDKTGKELFIKPAPVVAAEGIFVLYNNALRKELDLKVFIDAPESLRFQRRLKRDVNERGNTEEEVKYHFYEHSRPVFETLLSPMRRTADIILRNHIDGEANIEALTKAIKERSGF